VGGVGSGSRKVVHTSPVATCDILGVTQGLQSPPVTKLDKMNQHCRGTSKEAKYALPVRRFMYCQDEHAEGILSLSLGVTWLAQIPL